MPTENYEKRLNETSENIQQSAVICARNKELIQEYKRDKVLDGLSEATLLKNLTRLKVMSEHLEDQQLDEMDKADVKDLVAWIHSEYDNDETIDTYKNVIRSFWRWLDPDKDGDAPETVAWIKLNNSTRSDKLPKDLLTKDDIEAQVDAAKNPRDRALIWMLYETGARIGELIDLTVGDIEDRKHGKKVVIEGKTGSRRLPLVESVPYINKWLNDHPDPTKDAPLWCKIQQGSSDDQLGYRYIRDKILRKTMKEAEIDKPSNPHHYRHSRASYLANHLKEAQLCTWFGWVQGSDVPAKYVHLSGRDIDNAYDQMYGLYEPDEEEQKPDVVECPRCEELNEPDAAFCMRCGQALDVDAAEEVETAEEATTENADEEDIQLALRLVEAMRSDREEVETFVADLGSQ